MYIAQRHSVPFTAANICRPGCSLRLVNTTWSEWPTLVNESKSSSWKFDPTSARHMLLITHYNIGMYTRRYLLFGVASWGPNNEWCVLQKYTKKGKAVFYGIPRATWYPANDVTYPAVCVCATSMNPDQVKVTESPTTNLSWRKVTETVFRQC